MLKYVENIEEFDMLTKAELVAIYNGMDKTNYNEETVLKCRIYPRFIDLESLVKMTIHIKKQYPGWILTSVKCEGSQDSLPPRTYYSSKYITPYGHTFTL